MNRSLQRLWAMLLRQFYLHRHSPARVMEIVFWPVMDLLVWGFFSLYLMGAAHGGDGAGAAGAGGSMQAASFLIGAIILWDVLYRSQQAVSLSISEEVWVRNMLNVFIAPLRITELVASTLCVGIIKAFITTAISALLALVFFDYTLAVMGLWLVVLYAQLLLFGWAVGMVTMGLIFRFGRAAEALIWGIPFLLQPFSAVFYPLDTLPDWLATVCLALPSAHTFEAMRHVIAGHTPTLSMLLTPFGLCALWLTAASLYFAHTLRICRDKGLITRMVT